MTLRAPSTGGKGSKRSRIRDESGEVHSETSRHYHNVKEKYEGLLHVLSHQNDDSGSSNPGLGADISGSYVPDESAELELQQWNSMWTHLISMVTQVIETPTPIGSPSSPNEKRAILVDLVGKLCEAASQPVDSEDYRKLKEKYRKSKASLRSLRTQTQNLLHEVEQSKAVLESRLAEVSAKEETRLFAQVRSLEALLKRQFEKQEEFLNSEEPKVKPVRKSPHRERKPIPIDLVDESVPAPHAFSPPRRSHDPRPRPAPVEDEDSSICSQDVRHRVTTRKRREVAEFEADEVLQRRPRTSPKADRFEANHVNELVNLANRLQDDYRRLGKFYGDDQLSDMSIDELSRLNESLARSRV
jgi:hypothetical protein